LPDGAVGSAGFPGIDGLFTPEGFWGELGGTGLLGELGEAGLCGVLGGDPFPGAFTEAGGCACATVAGSRLGAGFVGDVGNAGGLGTPLFDEPIGVYQLFPIYYIMLN